MLLPRTADLDFLLQKGIDRLDDLFLPGSMPTGKQESLTFWENGQQVTRTVDLDAPNMHGIDHIFTHPGPPPVRAIVESKFNTSRLSTLLGNIRQMSFEWIERHIFNTFNAATADRIMRAGWSSVLANVSKNGEVTFSLLNELGIVVGVFTP